MTTRNFALVAGLAYLVIGVLGFVPMLLASPPADAPTLRLNAAYGYLFGLFPVNAAHSVVHLLIGGWGLVASRRTVAAGWFAASLAVIFGVLTILGLVPQLDTLFGYVPLHGHDVWLHALTAIVAAYFGFGRGRAVEVREDVRRAA